MSATPDATQAPAPQPASSTQQPSALKRHLQAAAQRTAEPSPFLFPEYAGQSRVLTDYLEIESNPVGKGSFGVVYGARTRNGNHRVAVKVIAKESLKDNFRMLVSEVSLLRRIDHPFIVKLYDIFEDVGTVSLVMEYMAGGELFRRISQVYPKGFGEHAAAAILRRVCDAVAYLHEHGIIHRDLKPENIIFDSQHDDVAVKISDFGLAKVVDGETIAKTACGSPSYVAPEVLRRLPEGYTNAVDMWSIGVIAYVLLCGFQPFHHANMKQQFQMILAGEYHFPSPYWDHVSPVAKNFIQCLLLLNPAERLTARSALEHPFLAMTNGSPRASGP